jgi:hypothetical protein
MPVSLMLLGFFDIGHSLFMRAVLEGQVQRAARDSGLETSGTAAAQATIDARVREQVLQLNENATITVDRRFFRTFTRAAVGIAEPWNDANRNGECKAPETYSDENNNNMHDMDIGNLGQGGAKDSVLYTVTVTYPRLFPLTNFKNIPGFNELNLPRTTRFTAKTVMSNQPYGEQGAEVVPTVRTCPT